MDEKNRININDFDGNRTEEEIALARALSKNEIDNPLTEVVKKILKSDADSCVLARKKLTEIEQDDK